MAPRRLRKSQLDDYADIVGVLSDKEVAERSGVTPESVRTFRMRRVIPASWRGETEEQLLARLAEKGQLPTPTKPRRKRKKKRKQRASKLDPVKHLLGQMPDRQLADMAGVSPENVRAYRKRRNIPAVWRDAATAPAPTPPSAKAPAPAKAAPKPSRSKAAPKASLALQSTVRPSAAPAVQPDGFAWRLIAMVGEDKREYVTFGGTMLDAVERGTEQLARLHRGGRIIEVNQIALVL